MPTQSDPLEKREALEKLCQQQNLTITTYKKDLYKALTKFWTNQGLNLRPSSDDSPASLSMIRQRNPNGFVIITNSEGEIVASCLTLFDGLGALLTHLAVSRTLRGTGLANALIEYGHAMSFSRGAQYMYLFVRAGEDNQPLVDYYKQYGYVEGSSTTMFFDRPVNE